MDPAHPGVRQLGFEMVKWVRAIEFVESHKSFGEGERGYNDGHEY